MWKRLRTRAKHTKAPRKYKFNETNKWTHFDYTTAVGNHFVMYNGAGKPLVTLAYQIKPSWREKTKPKNVIQILEIQRASRKRWRSLIFPDAEAMRDVHLHDVKKSRERNEKAQKELGMHTSEFILREFLYRNREKIKNGELDVELHPPNYHGRAALPYQTIINRYFRKVEFKTYELSMKKKRVKEIIG